MNRHNDMVFLLLEYLHLTLSKGVKSHRICTLGTGLVRSEKRFITVR